MVAALEDSTASAANQQLQDMLNNAITDPDKFRNLSMRVKTSHVGKNCIQKSKHTEHTLRIDANVFWHVLLVIHKVVLPYLFSNRSYLMY